MTHDAKVQFFMPYFSISKIILLQFNIDNNESELGIGYGKIIGHYMMVQLGLLDNFKRQVFQWYGATVTIE